MATTRQAIYDDCYRALMASKNGQPTGSVPFIMFLDFLFQRYGWDYWTYMAQPSELMDELMELYRAEGDARGGKRGYPADRPIYGSREELLMAAKSAGLPVHQGMLN